MQVVNSLCYAHFSCTIKFASVCRLCHSCSIMTNAVANISMHISSPAFLSNIPETLLASRICFVLILESKEPRSLQLPYRYLVKAPQAVSGCQHAGKCLHSPGQDELCRTEASPHTIRTWCCRCHNIARLLVRCFIMQQKSSS